MSGNVAIVSTREEAHDAVMRAYVVAKGLIADGKRARITVGEDDDSVSVRQRRFLHGPVLTQISEQVRVDGMRYVTAIWKEYFRNLFLGSRHEEFGRTLIELRNSTEDLGVKAYSEYIDRVIAHATTEWSVAFEFDPNEREAVRYKAPVRKRAREAATC